MTVQSNNFREMPLFVDLGREFHCDRVTFNQLVDWGTFSADEFVARAVHHPQHPDHGEFLDMLDHPTLSGPIVNLSNLSAIQADHRVRAEDHAVA